MRSKILTHDDNNRKEFKEEALRRVYNALNSTAKSTIIKLVSKEVLVKGLIPKRKGV